MMNRVTCVGLFALLSCAPAGRAPAVVAPAEAPALASTPAGRAVQQFLAAYNTGRTDSLVAAIARLYAAPALERRSAADRAAGFRLWLGNYGSLTPVRVDSLTATAAVVTVRESLTGGWGVVYFDVDSVAPHPVTGVGLLPFTEPPDWGELTTDTEAELAADLRSLASRLEEAGAFAGAVLLMRDGHVLVREAYGQADQATGRPNTPETRFELASASKMFTAVATLQQMESGRLMMEATVGSVLTDLPRPAADATIHQLFTMSSGIPDLFRSPRYWAERTGIRTLSDYWRYFAASPLGFPPGTSWSYSNSNFLLLGSVVERATGQRFEDVVAQRVFSTAGMSSTGYRPGPAGQRARGYTRMRPGSRPGVLPDPDRWYPAGEEGDTTAGSPAGGGSSTVDDLARFGQALMDGRLLSMTMVHRAFTGHVAAEYGGRHGYGFETRIWNGVRIVGHGGAFTGVSTQIDLYPDHGYILVVLGNSDASGAQALAHRVRGMLASSPGLARRP